MSGRDSILKAMQTFFPSFARSDGSIEAKLIDVVGSYADSEAIERQNTLDEINEALANQRITNKDYYRRKSVAFQLGDTLSYDPVSQLPYYETIDVEKQIVKQSYIVGEYPQFTNLINAIGDDGHLRIMTDAELDSFRTYFDAFLPLAFSININSLEVAKVYDQNLVIYVRSGVDANQIVTDVTQALLTYEQTFRKVNTVSLSEIEDIIQSVTGVRAIGWDDPYVSEQQLDGSYSTIRPVKGIFTLTNGAFTFATTLTTSNIKLLQ